MSGKSLINEHIIIVVYCSLARKPSEQSRRVENCNILEAFIMQDWYDGWF